LIVSERRMAVRTRSQHMYTLMSDRTERQRSATDCSVAWHQFPLCFLMLAALLVPPNWSRPDGIAKRRRFRP